MKNKELKNKYKTDFKVVQEAVNLFDPYGLIKGGAPIDEYDFLTDIILSGLYRNLSNNELRELIIKELGHDFDLLDDTFNQDQFRNNIEELITETKNKIKRPNC
jgi:transcriptional antiterminator